MEGTAEKSILSTGGIDGRIGDSRLMHSSEKVGARILIVDDDRNMLEILSDMLSSMGYRVEVANGAEKGLNMFLQDPFDLVFTDLNMPGMDGWSLASQIKDTAPETPVVLITGEMEAEVREKLRDSCVDNAIFKPFGLKEIIGAANRMLVRRRRGEARPLR